MSRNVKELGQEYAKAGFNSISRSLKDVVWEIKQQGAPEHFEGRIVNHFFTQTTEDGKKRPLSKKDLLEQITSYESMPEKVADTLKRMHNLGINSFDCYRLLVLGSRSSGMRIPEQIYYHGRGSFDIEHISFNKDTIYKNKKEVFILVDNTKRQKYGDVLSKKTDESDLLGNMLAKLRREKKIPHEASFLPEASRFGISVEYIENVVFPELVKKLEMEGEIKDQKARTRFLSVPEFIALKKFYYPDFGKIDSFEWVNFRLKGDSEDNMPDHNFVAGNIDKKFRFAAYPRDQGVNNVTFRPVIEFSSLATAK